MDTDLINGLFHLPLLVLAVYRVSILIAWENAPYGVAKKLRQTLGRKASNGQGVWYELAELVNCPYCLGVWVAIIPALFYWRSPLVMAVMWLAISGGQYLLTAVTERMQKD